MAYWGSAAGDHDKALPLDQYKYFSSQSFDALQHELCRALIPHKLKLLQSTKNVNAHINCVTLDKIKIQTMAVGAAMEVAPLDLEEFYIVHMPFRGEVRLRVKKEEYTATPGHAVILSPGTRIGAVWSENSCALLLTIPRNLMGLYFENVYGFSLKEPLKFDPALDLGSVVGSVWQRLWTYLLNEIEQRPLDMPVDKWVSHINPLIIETLIGNLSHSCSEITAGRLSGSEPPWVMQAEAYMHSNADERPSLQDIATHVGVSPRMLSRKFQQYKGCSPIRRFQNICLDSARRELSRGQGSVTDVALNWGFNELGRFSKLYYERFAEKPSETLRKNRRRYE